MIIKQIMNFLGGLSVFILGVRLLSESCEKIFARFVEKAFKKFGGRVLPAFSTGVVVSAISQSSVAVNSSIVSLVNCKAIKLKSACALIVGVNVGTTITTQIISLSGLSFDLTSFAGFLAFVGIILSYFKKTKNVGEFLIGFGFIFLALDIIGASADYFKQKDWFINFFKIKNPFLLFSYGILIPSIMQSSACLTGIMVVLSNAGILQFSSCVYLLLGANIGSCVGVFFSLNGKGKVSLQTALFNLYINIFGAIVFFPIMLLFPQGVTKIFTFLSPQVERQMANFHTLYNVLSAFLVLPFLNFFVNLTNLKSPAIF